MTENTAVTYNVVGQKVALGPLRRDLSSLYTAWINDFAVARNLGMRLGPVTSSAEEAWYDRMSASQSDVTFTIYEVGSNRPIGNAGLNRIDHLHRVAEFGIMIGEKSCWGKGYGTEATALTLDYGFNALGLHNICLRVFAYNERGIRAYTKAGFREVGRQREAHWLAGRAYDIVWMDCLSTEFQSPVLAKVLRGEDR